MKIELSGRTALVTASTAGIGRAIAQGLASAGARVILNGRSTDSVERARRHLLATVPGADVLGVAADLSDAAGVETLLAGLPKVDILSTTPASSAHRTSSRPMTRPGSATGIPT